MRCTRSVEDASCGFLLKKKRRDVTSTLKNQLLFLFISSLLILLTACSKQESVTPLKVGMDLSYPPFETIAPDGKPAGISVEIAKALAEYLDRPVDIQNISFPGLIPSLNSGKVDIIISSMTATDERRKSVDFSDPYVSTGLCMLVPKDSAIESIQDADQPGKTVVVIKGTTGEVYATQKIKHARVLILDKENLGVLEILQGKADAFLYDQMSTWKNWQKHLEATRAILKPFQKEDWAIAIRKGNEDLREEVDTFLQDFREHGGFERLGDQFLGEQKKAFREQHIPFYF